MKLIPAILLILSMVMATGCGQRKSGDDTTRKIENYLSELEKAGFNGSVLVENDGKLILSEGYGFCNVERQIKNSPATIFDIGSVTKQFTAAAILKLEMESRLSTNDKISVFFEDVPADKADITIHDLLRHQSGLVSVIGGDYEKIDRKEFLEKVFSSPLRFEPGTRYSYSNIGYSLLALIIEKVSSEDYETYLYENLWKPAHMETTGYTRPRFDTSMIATGYDMDNNAWGKPTDKEWDKTSPYLHLKGNGGILSTVEDLYRWHRALMTEKILSREAKQKLYHPELRSDESQSSYYAYGWDVSQTSRNTTRVWHNGTNRIFYADFMRFIDEGVVLIMLSNKSHPNFNGLNRELATMIFNRDFVPEIPAEDNEVNRSLTRLIINTIEEHGIEKARQEYQERNSGAQLLEFMMRDAGFDCIDNGKPELAIKIFEMNVFAFPESAKALQGLAEGYMETGNKELALQYFRESLNINPDNPFISMMISEIEE